ncbi:GGDEF domain-containing protein [Bradyrhizobium sp. USDA 4341]
MHTLARRGFSPFNFLDDRGTLANPARYQERLTEALDVGNATGKRVADLHLFKTVNDSLGHP